MLNDMKKVLLYTAGLALAIGGPIALFAANGPLSAVRKSLFPGSSASDSKSTSAAADATLQQRYAAYTPGLKEVLNFDVTVAWVTQHWPRVSSGLSQVQLQGYRVPLVTGVGVADVAGSLTYYFDSRQQVQRITLRGTTGNPTPLIQLLASRFRFTRRMLNDPGLILFESVDADNQLVGSLKIRSAPVIKASQPYTRYELDLVLNRPPQ
jgi:hypothetical protein